VHDSIWLDCHEDVALDACELVSNLMSSLRDVLQKDFPGAPCNVNFGVSASIGRNLLDTFSPQQWVASQKAQEQVKNSASSTPANVMKAVVSSQSKATAARSKVSSASPTRSSSADTNNNRGKNNNNDNSSSSRTRNVATPMRKSSVKRSNNNNNNGIQNLVKHAKKLA
jgi:hypothetical protein